MKINILFTLLFSCIMSLSAQKTFELAQLIPGNKDYLSPESPKGVAWFEDVLVYNNNGEICSFNKNGKQNVAPLITIADYNEALKNNNIDTLTGLPSFSFTEKEAISFINNNIVFYNIAGKSISKTIPLDENDKSYDLNSSYTMLSVRNGDSLIVINGDKRFKVSDNEEPGIVWGTAVHRNEFGIEKGTFWSPKGNKLAFYRMDETMVSDYPLVVNKTRVAEHAPIKYPMAGMPSHEVTVGVFNPATEKTVYLKTRGASDDYFTNIAWSDDEKYIYVAELNRAQNHMDLNMFDADNGEFIKTLFSESSDKYVEPESPLFFVGKDRFIWLSERDGYNHIYLYNTDGKLLKQLTSGDWEVLNIEKVDQKNGRVFFNSTEESPLESNLYVLDIKSGKRKRLTKENGTHFTKISKSGNYVYDRFSSHETAGKSNLINTSTGKNTPVFEAVNPYDDFKMPEITIGTIKAADDTTTLYYRLVKPVDFDPNKKYPAVVYLYNGPHAQMITDSWNYGTRGWDIYMAQKGYVVFTIDGRGSAHRGRDFEQAIFHKLGYNEGLDQMKGIEYLTSLPYVDSNKIGIHGWSYGGFMTTYMMLTYPETFKVGVAGGPVMDWSKYEVMYGERYMGNPESNPEGYEYNNLPNKAGNLAGRLLIIQGDMDPVVVQQHALSFLKSSVDAGVYPDFFVYPGHEHNVRGIDRIHLSEKISRYFDDYLK